MFFVIITFATNFTEMFYSPSWHHTLFKSIMFPLERILCILYTLGRKFLNTVMKLCNLKCLHDHSFYNKKDQNISHKFTVFMTDSQNNKKTLSFQYVSLFYFLQRKINLFTIFSMQIISPFASVAESHYLGLSLLTKCS